tara:strand:- start:781 stop:1131 length:351 start_codon:yes stop_codon:yes gene_type:complete
MDSTIDFMPSQDEFKMIVTKIENSIHRGVASSLKGTREKPSGVIPNDENQKKKQKVFYLNNENSDLIYDFYDDYGRNISKQERRQELVPWVNVTYRKGKLYIPVGKKNALRSLRLL